MMAKKMADDMPDETPALNLHIVIDDDVNLPDDLDEERLQALCTAALDGEELPPATLTIRFVSLATSRDLHRQHFDVDTATDVMTFPDGGEDPESGRMHLGDLAVCPAVAEQRHADGQGQATWRDECHLYCLHGLLHLLGFDDIDADDRRRHVAAPSRGMRTILPAVSPRRRPTRPLR